MNWKKHLTLVGVLAVFVGVYFFAELKRHHVVRKRTVPIAPNELVRKMEKAEFTSIDTTGFWKELETNFAARAKVTVTNAPHIAELGPEVKRFLECYSKGTFDAYVDFKSAGAPYNFTFDSFTVKMVQAGISDRQGVIPSDEMAHARAVWRAGTQCDTNGVGPRITDVSLDRLTVFVHEWKNRMEAPTYRVAGKDTGAPQHRTATMIALKETPVDIQKKDGSVWYAVVGLPCRVDHATNSAEAHFLHVAFYWSDQSKKWLPQEMMDDAALKHRYKLPMTFPDAFSYPVFF